MKKLYAALLAFALLSPLDVCASCTAIEALCVKYVGRQLVRVGDPIIILYKPETIPVQCSSTNWLPAMKVCKARNLEAFLSIDEQPVSYYSCYPRAGLQHCSIN